MIPNFLLSAKVQIAIALITVTAAGFAGHKVTQMHYTAKIAKTELQHANAIIEAQNSAFTEIEAYKKIAKGVDNEYQTKLAALRDRYDAEFERLRNRADASAGEARKSRRACNRTGASPGNRLPRQAQEDITRLMQHADEQTQRLISCQQWVIQNE